MLGVGHHDLVPVKLEVDRCSARKEMTLLGELEILEVSGHEGTYKACEVSITKSNIPNAGELAVQN